MKRLALVLTGGGARAAYQAGAVRALAELWPHRHSPFRIIT
ncbi:MAG TPA: patatin-like phospholipase family protein, partial [bacterium]|nr:patatin-like phospholipase family protein [bacterium]